MRSRRAVVGMLALGVGLGLGLGCGWKLKPRESGPASGAEGAQGAEGASALAMAPAFSLANDDGVHVSLDELLAGGQPAILVFYRGHW